MDQQQLHHTKPTFRPHDVYEKVRRLLDFEHGPKLRILDVGCGPGILDQRLRGYGHTVHGLDTYVYSPDSVMQCDINQPWPVADSSYDLVICTDVPEHVYDPVHILNESRRVLADNGLLIFGVPNHFDLRQRLKMLFGRGIVHWDNVQYGEKAWYYAHIRFFTLRELLKMFAESIWHPKTVQYNFMAGGIIPTRVTPAWLRRALLKTWPGLFSGKFIALLSKKPSERKDLYLEKTPYGL